MPIMDWRRRVEIALGNGLGCTFDAGGKTKCPLCRKGDLLIRQESLRLQCRGACGRQWKLDEVLARGLDVRPQIARCLAVTLP